MDIPFDPPVHPFSEAVEIRRWLDRLHALRAERRDDPAALGVIEERIRDAMGWLAFRGYDPAARAGDDAR